MITPYIHPRLEVNMPDGLETDGRIPLPSVPENSQSVHQALSHQAEVRARLARVNEAFRLWSTAAIPAILRQEIEEAAKERSLSTPVLVAELCESFAASCRLRRIW